MVLRYFFEPVENCEMCGDSSMKHKLLGQRLNRSQGLSPKKKAGISVSVKKCAQCGLIYSFPQPIPFEIQDHYEISPENYWRPEYFELEAGYFSDQLAVAKNLLSFQKGMSALDVGSGLGKCMIALEKEGFDAYGFEPSKPFYERSISKMNINPLKLKLGAIEEVDYQNSFFDFITFGAVFEHLYHPARSLEKTMKWLKPNGIIHIEVPSSKWFIAKLINFYYRLKGTNFVTNLSPMHIPFHLYEFDIKSFKLLGERLGFTIEKYKYDVCEVFFVPKLFRPLFRKYMEWTNTGMQLTVYLRKK